MSSSSEQLDDRANISFVDYVDSLRIPYEDIKLATNNFTDANLLSIQSPSSSSFRKLLYKGKLKQSGGPLIDIVTRIGLEEQDNIVFNELVTSYLLTHKNILPIFKISGTDDPILINKYEANESLDKHLSDPNLTWMQRLHICMGVAHALRYIHDYDAEGDFSVIHGNIKSSKILLDENWEPKLNCFGFSMFVKKYQPHLASKYSGTLQYTDPEYVDTERLTYKSDVFSFGVVLFEVLFGEIASVKDEDNWYFARLARSRYEEKRLDDIIDADLHQQMDPQSLEIFSEAAYFCVKEVSAERPDMVHIVEKLEASLKLQQDHEILILLEVHSNEIIRPKLGMDSTRNGLVLVSMEPQRSSFTIAAGPSLSKAYGPHYGSSLYQGSSLGSVSTDIEDVRETVKTAPRGDRGLAGLQNLGNTCFMNSALQCLVHTPPLVDYFLQDYTEEINKQNPLGMHGELAIAFGELLRKLWSSGCSAVPPRAFKGKFALFAPQFSGYNQHDSEELLVFLLDGLHEDLNRVKQKPYFETKDSDDRPDEEVANKFWSNHKARNDSIVVDVWQGQYKSTLVCPVCDKISITFDPFMYLSLPLPLTATRSMTVTVFYGDGSSLPMPFTVNVIKHGCCKDLYQALGTACCVGIDETLILAEAYDHQIYRYLDSGDSLHSIKDDECIVAYRLSRKQAEFPKLEICHRFLENSNPGERKRFLTPLVTYLEGAKNGLDIEVAVNRVLAPLKRKAFSSSRRSVGIKVSGSASEGIEESTSECKMDTEVGNSSDDKDLKETHSGELSLSLCLTDDRGEGCKPISKDSVIKSTKIVKVILDWTEKERDLYDASSLKDLPVVPKSGVMVKKTKQESISLFSCLDAFLKEEPLGPDDMWYCPGCKEHRQATKKLDLWRLPEIIVFHLKRFSYSRFLKNKLDTFVNFPIHNLDLSKYVKSKDPSGGSSVYELYAISNHYGGLGGGHYSAHAKLVEEDRWYHFDDSHVTPVSEGDIRTSAAYILFYQRVKTKPDESMGESNVHEDFED